MKDAKPSWGYIYLVNLLKNRVFDTIFTTNFDDLLNESCYQFSDDVRPIVCAHDSSIKNVRLTTKRPKIVKFHGDFLFDDIKNTLTELETLEDNMKDKFRQFAGEYGMIFLGYSGNDRSIMDLMDLLLKSDSNFPHGIYWCVRKGSQTNERVNMLRRFQKFRVIEIEGFDEFFSDIHEKMGMPLQNEVVDPYGALAKRLKSIIDNINMSGFDSDGKSSRIQRDSELIWAKIKALKNENVVINPDEETSISLSDGNVEFDLPIPFRMLSLVQQRAGNGEKAVLYMIKEAELRPSIRSISQLFDSIWKNNHPEFAEKALELLQRNKSILEGEAASIANLALPMMHLRKYDIAQSILDIAHEMDESVGGGTMNKEHYLLNCLQIKAHQKMEYSTVEIQSLEMLRDKGTVGTKMGACILLKEYESALGFMKLFVNESDVDIDAVLTWPIIQLLPGANDLLSEFSSQGNPSEGSRIPEVMPSKKKIVRKSPPKSH